MSAYKKLNRQDVYITSYSAKKSWEVKSGGGAFSLGFSSGFDIYVDGLGNVGINLFSVVERGTDSTNLIRFTDPNYYYRSLRQLYFTNFSGSVISGSFENFLQSSFETGSRALQTSGSLLTFPRNIIGTGIQPSSINFTVYSASVSASITDNGEGKLFISNSNLPSRNNQNVGDVIYSHGNLIFTDQVTGVFVLNHGSISGSWQSTQPIFVGNYHCKLKDYEFNYTQNPSAITSGSNGKLADNVTGSYFNPYITAIGLYNDANELVAVGKLGQPVPKSPDTEMTFQIKLDF